jgi:hypothetical protein
MKLTNERTVKREMQKHFAAEEASSAAKTAMTKLASQFASAGTVAANTGRAAAKTARKVWSRTRLRGNATATVLERQASAKVLPLDPSPCSSSGATSDGGVKRDRVESPRWCVETLVEEHD